MQGMLLKTAMTTALLASWGRGAEPSAATGITEVSRGKLVLRVPPDCPPDGSLRYCLGFPFQAGPRTAGIIVLRTNEKTPNYAFLDGCDVILLDELATPRREQVFAATRNKVEKDVSGKPVRMLLKSPLMGGFVPLGAIRANGTPHPHAGTGFGIAQAHWFPFPDGRFIWGDPHRKDMNEIYQFAYDGKTFTTRRTELRTQNRADPLRIGDTGWAILGDGLSNAIPENDDLLLPATATRVDNSAMGVGVIRWVCRNKAWQPGGYDPVATSMNPTPEGPNPKEHCPWMEPSLSRDGDGSLLFSVRGADTFGVKGPDASGYRVQVWRSAKAAKWDLVLDVPKTRLNSPVTVNVAADGSAYLVSNPYDPAFIPETGKTGRGRERVTLWPLTANRSRLEAPMLLRDCLKEFGEPPAAPNRPEKWMADHPNGMTVRLKDGRWRHLLAYRICHCPRYQPSGAGRSPHSGCYLEEVISRGPARPIWRFAEEQSPKQP